LRSRRGGRTGNACGRHPGDGAKGSAYGEAIYAAAQKPEGQITEIHAYMFPKPDTTTPTFEKVSFVTKVGDLGCGVGYYK